MRYQGFDALCLLWLLCDAGLFLGHNFFGRRQPVDCIFGALPITPEEIFKQLHALAKQLKADAGPTERTEAATRSAPKSRMRAKKK
jgi:hypothetical protein